MDIVEGIVDYCETQKDIFCPAYRILWFLFIFILGDAGSASSNELDFFSKFWQIKFCDDLWIFLK